MLSYLKGLFHVNVLGVSHIQYHTSVIPVSILWFDHMSYIIEGMVNKGAGLKNQGNARGLLCTTGRQEQTY
jgi:hypothetical protein